MFSYFLSLFVSVQVSDAYVKVLCTRWFKYDRDCLCVNLVTSFPVIFEPPCIIVFFSLNFSFFDMFLFLKNFCSMKYVLLAFFILSSKSIWLLLSSFSITVVRYGECKFYVTHT